MKTMRKVWIIARNEYLANIRRPGFLFMTALFPLMGLIGLGIAVLFSGQASSFLQEQFEPSSSKIGVVDQTGLFTPVLPEYADRYFLYADESSGREAVQRDEIEGLLQFPADYIASGSVKVTVKGSAFSAAFLENADTTRQFILDHLLHGRVEDSIRIRAAQPMDMQLETLGDTGIQAAGGLDTAMVTSFVVPYIVSLFLVISIFVSSGYLLQSVAEEKENRVMEILLSSVSARELMAGKILGLGAMGLTQILIWMISAVALSGGAAALLALAVPLFTRADILILAVVYYFLGFSLFAVLMTTAGSLGTTMRESQQIAGLFSFLAAAPYMVSGFLFTNPDALLARILSWIPFTAPTMMMLRLPLSGTLPWVDIVISLTGLILTIPVALWAGAKIFRMGLLMYGKRPSLRQIWSSLRQA